MILPRLGWAFLAGSLILAGCATPYQRKGLMGGYSDKKLKDDTFQVEFKGNNYTDAQMAKDFALLRAAEVTEDNDYRYFVIRDTESNFRNTAGNDTTRIPGSIISIGNVGVVKDQPKQPKPLSRTFVRYTIQCYKDKPAAADATVYDSEDVKQNIKESYRLK